MTGSVHQWPAQQRVRHGAPVAEAFDELARTTGLPIVARFADGVAVAIEPWVSARINRSGRANSCPSRVMKARISAPGFTRPP